MSKDNNIISTDNPLTAAQQDTLRGLADVIIPADDNKGMPSAKELDLVTYINDQAPEFIPFLIQGLDYFDDQFATLTTEQRHSLVEDFSNSQVELFNGILFQIFACYYQDDKVLESLGLEVSPPFPRGNEVVSGDLSLLDPVLKHPQLYRNA